MTLQKWRKKKHELAIVAFAWLGGIRYAWQMGICSGKR
jgi:hypothetical protein